MGDDYGLPGGDHPPGYAFAYLVAPPFSGLCRHAVRHLNLKLTGHRINDGHRTVMHAFLLVQNFHDAFKAVPQVR